MKANIQRKKNEGWIVFMAHGLSKQPVHLNWQLHLLLISVYQRSLAVYYFQARERLQFPQAAFRGKLVSYVARCFGRIAGGE